MSVPTGGARPARLERESLVVDGLRLAFRFSGPHSERPTVVVLHGWGASLDATGSIQACLSNHLRVLAFDLPGFGESDPPPVPWDSVAYATHLREALRQLVPGPVQLVGHSFGGKISLILANRWPDLVTRLVLVNSAGLRPPRGPGYRARVAAYKLARRLAGQGPLAEALAARFGSTDYRDAGALRGTLVRVVNEDLRPLLPTIGVPTLLIWGDQDAETPLAGAAIMEREIPDAGLVVFPGAGHFSYADDPARFCRVVGHFLG